MRTDPPTKFDPTLLEAGLVPVVSVTTQADGRLLAILMWGLPTIERDRMKLSPAVIVDVLELRSWLDFFAFVAFSGDQVLADAHWIIDAMPTPQRRRTDASPTTYTTPHHTSRYTH